MLKMLLKYSMKKYLKNRSTPVENILYPTEVYPIYLKVRDNFKYCMQHKLLKRQDLLEFKYKLNKFIDFKKYKYEKFKNDAHEIYTKLKDIDITKSQMSELNMYLKLFIK